MLVTVWVCARGVTRTCMGLYGLHFIRKIHFRQDIEVCAFIGFMSPWAWNPWTLFTYRLVF